MKTQKITKWLISSLGCVLWTHLTAMAHPNCSAGHCSSLGNAAVEQCRGNASLLGMSDEQYRARGGAAVTIEMGRTCTCPCSCVVGETSIATTSGYKQMADLTKNNQILTPISQDFISSLMSQFHVSEVSEEKVQKTLFSNGSEILSSPNHVFVTPDEMVISASQLKTGDLVLGADGSALTVQDIEKDVVVDGKLFNVSVNAHSNKPVDHVVNIEGVLSGDWLLQSTNDVVAEEVFLRTSLVKLFD